MTSIDPQCVYADGYEPNNTRAEATQLSGLTGLGMSIYPATDEDWLAFTYDQLGTAEALFFVVSRGARPTMDVYRDTVLVASGVTCAPGVLTPGVHDYEVRVVGAGVASYYLNGGATCPT